MRRVKRVLVQEPWEIRQRTANTHHPEKELSAASCAWAWSQGTADRGEQGHLGTSGRLRVTAKAVCRLRCTTPTPCTLGHCIRMGALNANLIHTEIPLVHQTDKDQTVNKKPCW